MRDATEFWAFWGILILGGAGIAAIPVYFCLSLIQECAARGIVP